MAIFAHKFDSKIRPPQVRKLTHEELVARQMRTAGALAGDRTPVAALLDNVRSLYNVGSIFRTSDGARIQKLYLCGYTPAPPRKEIQKTALGATETVPWSHHRDPLEAVASARAAGMKICVLEHTSSSVPIWAVSKADFPLCLIIGNELSGVSEALIAASDMAVEIPMYGTKQSLNAAVAYGIAVFELVRVLKA